MDINEDCDYYNNISIQGDTIVLPDVKYPANYIVHNVLKEQAKLHRELEVKITPSKEITRSEVLNREEANNKAQLLYLQKKQEINKRVSDFHYENETPINYTWSKSTGYIYKSPISTT